MNKRKYITPSISFENIEVSSILIGSKYCYGQHGWENCKGACGHKSNAPCHNHGNTPRQSKSINTFFILEEPLEDLY